MANAAHRFNNDLRYRAADHPAQTQITPPYVLEPVREVLGGTIALDPCTLPDNPVGADRFYAPPVDGLAEPWDAESIYVNPPYGKAREPWVERCVDAAACGAPRAGGDRHPNLPASAWKRKRSRFHPWAREVRGVASEPPTGRSFSSECVDRLERLACAVCLAWTTGDRMSWTVIVSDGKREMTVSTHQTKDEAERIATWHRRYGTAQSARVEKVAPAFRNKLAQTGEAE